MPAFDTNTPRMDAPVMGLKLTMPKVFAAGHPLTSDEASFINARLKSVMVNAYGGDLRRALEAIDKERAAAVAEGKYKGPWAKDAEGKEAHPRKPAEALATELTGEPWADHQANLDAKFAVYQVGGANGRETVSADPMDRVAREIAIREVKELLIKRGRKIKDAMDTKDPANAKRSMFQKYVEDRLNGSQRERIYALARVQVAEISDDDDQEFDEIPEATEATEAGEKDAA